MDRKVVVGSALLVVSLILLGIATIETMAKLASEAFERVRPHEEEDMEEDLGDLETP